MEHTVRKTAAAAAMAARSMASLSTEARNAALLRIAEALDLNRPGIIEANRRDIEKAREEGLAQPLLKRLVLDDARIDDVIRGIQGLTELPHPVGTTT